MRGSPTDARSNAASVVRRYGFFTAPKCRIVNIEKLRTDRARGALNGNPNGPGGLGVAILPNQYG